MDMVWLVFVCTSDQYGREEVVAVFKSNVDAYSYASRMKGKQGRVAAFEVR